MSRSHFGVMFRCTHILIIKLVIARFLNIRQIHDFQFQTMDTSIDIGDWYHYWSYVLEYLKTS